MILFGERWKQVLLMAPYDRRVTALDVNDLVPIAIVTLLSSYGKRTV